MVTLEELYKGACWEHHKAQQPWVREAVAFWDVLAAGLGMALRGKGLTDRQLRTMEEDGIAAGQQGRWEGLFDNLSKPDGTVAHED